MAINSHFTHSQHHPFAGLGGAASSSSIATSPFATQNSHLSNSSQQQQQQQQNTSRYKTELCRPFEENGTCKYGEKCQFAHGFSELRTLTRHPKYKTEFCRTFHTTGFCPYGPRCHFIHNIKTPSSPISSTSSADGSSLSSSASSTSSTSSASPTSAFHIAKSSSRSVYNDNFAHLFGSEQAYDSKDLARAGKYNKYSNDQQSHSRTSSAEYIWQGCGSRTHAKQNPYGPIIILERTH